MKLKNHKVVNGWYGIAMEDFAFPIACRHLAGAYGELRGLYPELPTQYNYDDISIFSSSILLDNDSDAPQTIQEFHMEALEEAALHGVAPFGAFMGGATSATISDKMHSMAMYSAYNMYERKKAYPFGRMGASGINAVVNSLACSNASIAFYEAKKNEFGRVEELFENRPYKIQLTHSEELFAPFSLVGVVLFLTKGDIPTDDNPPDPADIYVVPFVLSPPTSIYRAFMKAEDFHKALQLPEGSSTIMATISGASMSEAVAQEYFGLDDDWKEKGWMFFRPANPFKPEEDNNDFCKEIHAAVRKALGVTTSLEEEVTEGAPIHPDIYFISSLFDFQNSEDRVLNNAGVSTNGSLSIN